MEHPSVKVFKSNCLGPSYMEHLSVKAFVFNYRGPICMHKTSVSHQGSLNSIVTLDCPHTRWILNNPACSCSIT